VIHGRLAHVERERRDRLVHEDAEVVSEVCARDTECPHGGQDERVAGDEERDGGVFDERGEESWVGWLRCEGFVVPVYDTLVTKDITDWNNLVVVGIQIVSEDTQRENGHS
jgi:hypothetical protein